MNYRRAMTGAKRILADQCCGAIIDYQDFWRNSSRAAARG